MLYFIPPNVTDVNYRKILRRMNLEKKKKRLKTKKKLQMNIIINIIEFVIHETSLFFICIIIVSF